MKKLITIFLAFGTLAVSSCDSFLNRQEDEQMTFEKSGSSAPIPNRPSTTAWATSR